jgi:hypothetical protein
MEIKEIDLPSGAKLRFRHPPYADADALLKAVMMESVKVPILSQDELLNLSKTHLCVAFSSDAIQKALWKCMASSTYHDERGDLKIEKDLFEPVSAREDYPILAMEVLQQTLAPFGKSLLLVFSRLSSHLAKNRESK